jgi:hypothetical protein
MHPVMKKASGVILKKLPELGSLQQRDAACYIVLATPAMPRALQCMSDCGVQLLDALFSLDPLVTWRLRNGTCSTWAITPPWIVSEHNFQVDTELMAKELGEAIDSMTPSKAPGNDRVSRDLLKSLKCVVVLNHCSPSIKSSAMQCWKKGVVPSYDLRDKIIIVYNERPMGHIAHLSHLGQY